MLSFSRIIKDVGAVLIAPDGLLQWSPATLMLRKGFMNRSSGRPLQKTPWGFPVVLFSDNSRDTAKVDDVSCSEADV